MQEGIAMRRYSGNMKGEKFMGNKNTFEVHDLDNEKSLCNINLILNGRYDVPFNSLYEANKQHYTNCICCIGRNPK